MDFKELFENAQKAGREAARACSPTPMVVGEAKDFLSNEIDETKPIYYVPDGVCGFAWIDIVHHKASPVCKFVVEQGIGKKRDEGKGVYIWISDYNQSMQLKEAHAFAMAKYLREHGSIAAWAHSRMD